MRAHARLLLVLFVLLLTLTACASNSGIFSGGSWQASGLQKQHLQVLAVDPNHLQHIYAGDAQDGVFASTDAGATWKASSIGLPTPLAVNTLSFDLDGKKLYAATSAGLFVSSDSATSWSRVAGVPAADSYSSLSFDANTPQVVYVASAHAGVLESRDNGVSWTSVSSGLPEVALTSVLYDPNQKNLWAAATNSIYRSSDNGATWRAMNTGLPASVGVNVLALGAVSSSSGDLIFAGTDHGFFITSDAGQHWAQSQFSLANLKVRAVLLDATQPAVVYASTDIGVLRSNDSGQNWTDVASGLPGNQPFAGLAQGDVNYAQLLLASRGIYRYPGTASALDPSRLLPILLVLLFFFLLYYFFARHRRRLSRPRPVPDTPVELDKQGGVLDESSSNDKLNGRHPPSDDVQNVPEDERKES
ncbi:MAG TPA: hypothetical protein VF458_16845 [Ktedonobacteraceae bacterium]